MGTRDRRVDAYIAKAADFAQPILAFIRDTVHAACPDCTETIKWGMPHFERNGIICHMAAFKQHCALGFYRQRAALGLTNSTDAMGQFGRVTTVADLPPKKTLAALVEQAAALNAGGVTPRRRARASASPVRVPADLASALKQHRKARTTFDGFSPSHKREYVEWITGAKREETRKKRVETAVAWLSEGKTHNWRYEGRATR